MRPAVKAFAPLAKAALRKHGFKTRRRNARSVVNPSPGLNFEYCCEAWNLCQSQTMAKQCDAIYALNNEEPRRVELC
jgi:hypothetical protein